MCFTLPLSTGRKMIYTEKEVLTFTVNKARTEVFLFFFFFGCLFCVVYSLFLLLHSKFLFGIQSKLLSGEFAFLKAKDKKRKFLCIYTKPSKYVFCIQLFNLIEMLFASVNLSKHTYFTCLHIFLCVWVYRTLKKPEKKKGLEDGSVGMGPRPLAETE